MVLTTPHTDDMIERPRLSALILYFLRLGTLGFGGPFALCHAMQRDLVEKRRWFKPDEFITAVAVAQFAPGPLATQVAIYLGWLAHGYFAATLVALAFTLPAFLVVVGLGYLYVTYNQLVWIQQLSYGMAGVIVAIMARSAYGLTKSILTKQFDLWLIFIASLAFTLIAHDENIWLFLAAGIGVILARNMKLWRRPFAAVWLLPLAYSTPLEAVGAVKLSGILTYFLKIGAMVFGSGMVIVPFLHSGVVEQMQWLSEKQFIDAVAVGMITPGPMVIAVAFVGFLVHGLSGAAVAAFGVFLPCYLFVVLPAPFYQRLTANRYCHQFILGVTAAAIGAVASAAIIVAKVHLTNLFHLAVLISSFLILHFCKRVPQALLIALGAMLGWLLH